MEQLMIAANRGDSLAYARLLKSLSSELRGYIRNSLRSSGGNQSDLEDILQETLLALHAKRHTWRDSEPLRPWVYAIARYKVIDALRRRGRRGEVDLEDHADTLAAEVQEEGPSALEVDRALRTLTPRLREVVSAISLEGTPIAEVARRLEMTEVAVRVSLHRGLTALHERFGRGNMSGKAEK